SLARFTNGASASINPPRTGSGSGCMPALRRNGNPPSIGADFDATPELIRQLEVDHPVLGEPDRDLALRDIELGPYLQHVEGCVERGRARRIPGALVILLAQPGRK